MARKSHFRSPPKNDRQLRLFTPAIEDISPRDVQDAMEMPFLSLSKQKRTKPIEYTSPKGAQILVEAPERTGIANIYDWDLIIFLVAIIRDHANKGLYYDRSITFAPGDFLDTVRRPNTKHYQDGIVRSLRRLNATTITTNIRKEHQDTIKDVEQGFHWVDGYKVETRTVQTAEGPKEITSTYTVDLCRWLFEAAANPEMVLAIDDDYFLLKGGYERWLYRLVRKSAGHQQWRWKLRTLYERSGEGESYKYFAANIRQIVKDNDPDHPSGKLPIPGYRLSLEVTDGDYWLVAKAIEQKKARAKLVQGEHDNRYRAGAFAIDFETEDHAKQICIGAGLDYYSIFEDWKTSTLRNKAILKNPNKAFLAYVQKAAKNERSR